MCLFFVSNKIVLKGHLSVFFVCHGEYGVREYTCHEIKTNAAMMIYYF
jgi:hypothetical protein